MQDHLHPQSYLVTNAASWVGNGLNSGPAGELHTVIPGEGEESVGGKH